MATASLLLLAPPAAAHADVFVDFETGTDSGTCGDTVATPCKSVFQGATNAGAGETVRVDDTPGNADTSMGINLDQGKSLIAQEFVGGDENALPEPDTIIDAGLATFFPAISVPAMGGGGTIQGFVIRSAHQPLSLASTTTLSGNRIDEDAGIVPCLVTVTGSGNISTIGPDNVIVDPTPMASTKAGVCVQDSAAPTITTNTFTDLSHGVQSAGGSAAIASNLFTGTQGSTSDAAIEVNSGAALSIRTNTIVDPGNTFVSGIVLRQSAETPVVGATIRRNTIIGHRFGVIANDTEATVLMDSNLIAKSTNAGLAQTDTGNDDDANVTASNLTIFDGTGFEITLSEAALTLNSSIIGNGGITYSGGATCAISFSRGPTTGAGCANFQTMAAPGFVNPAGNDYHLAGGSPMIDSGDPGLSVFPEDIDGQPRVTDGNGDGVVRRDVGADETLTFVASPTPTPINPAGAAPAVTGQRAAALKKCKKRKSARSRRKCRKRAQKLPL
jgi:hypothetical protein